MDYDCKFVIKRVDLDEVDDFLKELKEKKEGKEQKIENLIVDIKSIEQLASELG